MSNKTLTLLGFASKAGKLSYGFSAVLESLNQNKVRLIIAALDLSPKTLKEAVFHAEKKKIEVLTLKTADIFVLSKAIGRKCGVVAVNDDGFAKAIKEDFLNDQ